MTTITVVEKPQTQHSTFQQACAQLASKIEATFQALTRAFKRGPDAVREVDALACKLGKLESQYQSMTGDTHICR